MKKMINKLLMTAILTAAVCTSFAACRDADGPSGAATDHSVINGKEIAFIEDERKRDWEEPLERLLSNVLVPYGEGGDILGYTASRDPEAPAIPQSHGCGLMDITNDGVPELLVLPLGYSGSSGAATYFIYDIGSGQQIGTLDGSHSRTWCFYYDTVNDECVLIGQYWLRYGWSGRDRFVQKVGYDAERKQYGAIPYLRSGHEIGMEPESGSSFEDGWTEIYPRTDYYVNEQAVSLDDYYAEYDDFVRNLVRIPETALHTISWDEVSEQDDDYTEKGRKMARALIQSEQAFISP